MGDIFVPHPRGEPLKSYADSPIVAENLFVMSVQVFDRHVKAEFFGGVVNCRDVPNDRPL